MAEKISKQRPAYWQNIGRNADEILNVRAEVTRNRSTLSAAIDAIGRVLSHPAFFVCLLASHLLWIAVNLPVYPWFTPWDPYPFTFLATIASAEAPFIALLVLMHERRESRIGELREEISLQVSLHVERELSMALRLMRESQHEMRITSAQDSDELDTLCNNLDPRSLMHNLRRDLRETEGEDATAA